MLLGLGGSRFFRETPTVERVLPAHWKRVTANVPELRRSPGMTPSTGERPMNLNVEVLNPLVALIGPSKSTRTDAPPQDQ